MHDAVIDHLIYATPDLEETRQALGSRLGFDLTPGGPHVGLGTRNFLLPLQDSTYLELIGPDPEQTDFAGTRPYGIDHLAEPRLVGWAIRVDDIDKAIDEARDRGYDPGPARSMSRRRPDGMLLTWRLTSVPGGKPPILIPFLIDWGDAPHPSTTPGPRAELRDFRIETPSPETVRQVLEALGVTVAVDQGQTPRLSVSIAGLSGEVHLG